MKMKTFFLFLFMFNLYFSDFNLTSDIDENLSGFQASSAGGSNISLKKLKISELKPEELKTKYSTDSAQDDSLSNKVKFLSEISKIVKLQLQGFGVGEQFNLEESLQKKSIQISSTNNLYADYFVIKRDEEGEDLEGDQNWNYLVLHLSDSQNIEERSIEYEIEVQYIYPLLPMTINHLERNLQRFEIQYKKVNIDLKTITQQVVSILDVFKQPQNPEQNLIYFEPSPPQIDEHQVKFVMQVIPLKYGEIEMTLSKDTSGKSKQLKVTYESNFFYFEDNLAILNEIFLAQALEKSLQDIRTEVFHNLQELSKDQRGDLDPLYIDFIINSDPSLIYQGKAVDPSVVDYSFTTQQIGQNLMIQFVYDTTKTQYKLMKNTGKITIKNYFPIKSLYNPVIFPSRFVIYILDILRKIKKKENVQTESTMNLYEDNVDTNPFAFDIPTRGEPIKNFKFVAEKSSSSFNSDLTEEDIEKLLKEIWGDQKNVTIKIKKVSARKKKLLLL